MEQQILRIGGPYKGRVSALAIEDQPPGTIYESRDVVGRDCKTGRTRLSVRPGYSTFGSLTNAVGFGTLGNAYDEPGGVQLMAATSTTLYRFTSGLAWSSVGTITTSASRTIHMASYGKRMFVACNDPYKYYDYDSDDDGTPHYTPDGDDVAIATWNSTNPDTSVTAGTIPPNCRIVVAWGSRMVLLGDPDNPHVINFSRNDDPFDWDFAEEDTGAAVSVAIDEAATCAIAHNRDCLIVGTRSGMWIFRGNPSAANAILEKFSFVVGPINSSAWCKTADDYTYILANNGLYKMAPGCGASPEDVSHNAVPDLFQGLNGVDSKAYLVYNEKFRFVEIHVQGTGAGSWLYDVDGGGFYKITAPGTSILAAYRFGPADSSTASGSLVGTAGGVYRLDNAQALGGSDLAYATFVLPLAEIGQAAKIVQGRIIFGANTSGGTGVVEICGGSTGELAAARTAERKHSITLATLLANKGSWVPNVGGHAAALTISQGDVSDYWSVEGIALYVRPCGQEKG